MRFRFSDYPLRLMLYLRRVLVLVSLAILGSLCATVVRAQEAEVRDPNFRREGGNIVVTYDLIGKEGEEYEVNLLLSQNGGETFDYQPKTVTGDVGGDLTPGLDKRINWFVLQDFPDGLQGANVTFKLTVEKEGGNAWWYVLGSALVAGGGGTAAAVFGGLIGGGDGGGDGGTGGSEIPPPDGPPN